MTIHPKAAGAGMSGALAVILLWAIGYAVDVPLEVGAAFTAVLAYAGAWLAPWFAATRPEKDVASK